MPATPAAAALATFHFVGVPASPPAPDQLLTTSQVTLGADHSALGFHTLLTVGETIGSDGGASAEVGRSFDRRGHPMTQADGAALRCNSLDQINLLDGGDGPVLVSHLECHPGGMALTRLARSDGGWRAIDHRPAQLGAAGGGGLFCAGERTPWGSHLAGEEYEPDMRTERADHSTASDLQGFAQQRGWWGGALPPGAGWRQGLMVELHLTGPDAHHRTEPHPAMGRFSHELGRTMPDRRTVYLTDDGTNGGFFMFVADAPDDLSAGTLYAARWLLSDVQQSAVSWVSLGHASDAALMAAIERGARFDDLFVAQDPDDAGTCPADTAPSQTSWGLECLAIKPGQAALASRLETRRVAALLGATTELSKSEGLAYDASRGTLYMASSRITRGMGEAHPRFDHGGPDHVRLPVNECGMVWAMTHADPEPPQDTAGAPIDSAYVVTRASARIVGMPNPDGSCADDGIANPDNLAVGPDGTLFIAEDTRRHAHNAIWALAPGDAPAVRIAVGPAGAEFSGLGWHQLADGTSWITLTVQHNDAPDAPASYGGVLGPMPKL